jgi:small-conductance mechanosensitive channel
MKLQKHSLIFCYLFILFFNRILSIDKYEFSIENKKAIASVNKQSEELQKYKHLYNEIKLKLSAISAGLSKEEKSSQVLINFISKLEEKLSISNKIIIKISEKIKKKLNHLYEFFAFVFNSSSVSDDQDIVSEVAFKEEATNLHRMVCRSVKLNKVSDIVKVNLLDKVVEQAEQKHELVLQNPPIVLTNDIGFGDHHAKYLELQKIDASIMSLDRSLTQFRSDIIRENLIIEKKILEYSIPLLEKKLKKMQKNIFSDSSLYEKKKHYYKKEQKKCLEKKKLSDKEIYEKFAKSSCEKSKILEDIDNSLSEYNKNKNNLNGNIFVNNIEYAIFLFANLISADIIKLELDCYEKNIAIVDALFFGNQKEAPVNKWNHTMKELSYELNKDIYDNNDVMIKKNIASIEYLIALIKRNNLNINPTIITKLEVYAVSLKNLQHDLFQIMCTASFLHKKLQDKLFWTRSENSLTWPKVKNFFLEINLFARELKNKFMPTMNTLLSHLCGINEVSLWYMLCVILFIFFIVLTSYVYKFFFEKLFYIIDSIEVQSYYLRQLSLFINVISHQKIIFFIWINIFLLVYAKVLDYYYINTIFYLLSIFISFYFIYNIYQSNYKKKFYGSAEELTWWESCKHFFLDHISLYLIVALFFFRLALTSLIYGNADKIISIVQFIILQAQMIIFLKQKDIMQKIINFNFFNDTIKKYITRYYEFIIFLLTIIVIMSNPYVGYGNQVFYFFSRSFISILLLPLWSFVFEFVKNHAVYVFFIFEDGEARGNLRNAKLLYFLFLLCFYFITISIMVYLILNVWGYDLNFDSIKKLAFQNLLPQNNADHAAFFSLYNLYTPIFYIFQGYLVSYLVNNLVLTKILNPIVIGQTMQNTVMILIRYIIISTFFIIGLCMAGLEGIIVKLGTLIVGFSFALKEPVADFICYFIILIQCPIKVGDLIRINREGGGGEPEVTGIVRSIKGRTTIVRQRNGQTVIIPNSLIVKRTIFNWTYYKSGFISIEDFVITVDRSIDIDYVKGVILKVIDGHPAILKNPLPLLRCENITALGYEFLIRGYISPDRAYDQWDIASQLRIMLIKKLHQEKINFAIPSFNIYTKNIDQINLIEQQE